MRWPIGIALGLLLVVVVNAAMTWLALSSPPQIEPSYEQIAR